MKKSCFGDEIVVGRTRQVRLRDQGQHGEGCRIQVGKTNLVDCPMAGNRGTAASICRATPGIVDVQRVTRLVGNQTSKIKETICLCFSVGESPGRYGLEVAAVGGLHLTRRFPIAKEEQFVLLDRPPQRPAELVKHV